MKKLLVTLIATTSLTLTLSTTAAEFTKGTLTIDSPTAMPTAPGQPHGAIFINELRNNGKVIDELVGARSNASKTVEVHQMSMDNNVMKMREIPGIAIPANGKVSMRRGNADGYHLMLMNLNRPLQEGAKLPVTLIFKSGAEIDVTVEVQKPQGMGHGGHMKH